MDFAEIVVSFLLDRALGWVPNCGGFAAAGLWFYRSAGTLGRLELGEVFLSWHSQDPIVGPTPPRIGVLRGIGVGWHRCREGNLEEAIRARATVIGIMGMSRILVPPSAWSIRVCRDRFVVALVHVFFRGICSRACFVLGEPFLDNLKVMPDAGEVPSVEGEQGRGAKRRKEGGDTQMNQEMRRKRGETQE